MSQFYQEGAARFVIGHGFYRPQSRIVRDLAVLAAAVYRTSTQRLRVLDGMSATGVRSLRYYHEAGADWVWANEGNPELMPTLQRNLQVLLPDSGRVSALNLQQLCMERCLAGDRYDLVDIDAFGSASGFVQAALAVTRLGGLIYLTSTDGRTYSGREPHRALRQYGAYVRSHPSVQEQGLRLLLGTVQQQAAQCELGIEPIFSLFWGDTCRVMVRLLKRPQLTSKNYGFLGYCHHCGNYFQPDWRKLSHADCPHDQQPLVLSGPLWLGSLHQPLFLEKMQQFADTWQWQKVAQLISVMMAESSLPPYFFTLRDIGRRAKLDLPPCDRLIAALQAQGFAASRTHINPQAIKTTASMQNLGAIASTLNN